METESQHEAKKKYEVAFLLKNEEALGVVGEILKNAGLSVIDRTEMKNITLAYPIKKEKTAHFVVLQCEAQENADLQEMRKHMQVEPSVVRFLVIAQPAYKTTREPRASVRAQKTMHQTQPTVHEEPKEHATVVSNEELEKKLEEILQ